MKTPAPTTGAFPRLLRSDLLWTGGCLDIAYKGKVVHSHASAYVVAGSEKTMLIDTGSPNHWGTIEKDVDEFLQGRPLDYVFCTHVELPHAGLLVQWLYKYPDAIALGDLGDYPLYFPDHVHQMRNTKIGDRIDLGDREIIVLPAIWRDLSETQWVFDTKSKVMFVSDAFAYLHYHMDGQCDMLSSEQPLPDLDMIQFFNERALFWTQHTDVRNSFADLDEMLSVLRPKMLATAHGGVVDSQEAMVPRVKEGMIVRNTDGGTGL